MCDRINGFVVNDFLQKLVDSGINEAVEWVREFRKSFAPGADYFGRALTPECVVCMHDDFRYLISRSLLAERYSGQNVCNSMLWIGHAFMDEFRQKAVAFGIDIDSDTVIVR